MLSFVWLFSFLTNKKKKKKNAVLQPRTGPFRELVGFKDKANDLSFEAQDFKMCSRGCPQGQGRPRGLHL